MTMNGLGSRAWLCIALFALTAPAWAAAPPPSYGNLELLLDAPEPPTPTDPADIAARKHCKRAEWWEFIGAVRLKDGEVTRLVCLYAQDTDNSAFGAMMYPNAFSVIGAYQDDRGKWVQAEAYSVARTSYGRAVSSTPDGVVIKLRGNRIVFIQPEWSEDERRRWMEIGVKANAPRQLRVRFVSGRLVGEDQRAAK
jgi:hypothetical protein